MNRVLFALWIVLGATIPATANEFPITTLSGNQLYPDVCWDGEAFWVVWQDEELGTIRGVRVSKGGQLLTDEVEFLDSGSFQSSVCLPVAAAGTDRIAVEARVLLYYSEFGSPVWGIMHNEFSFEGTPIYLNPMVLGEPTYDREAVSNSTPVLLFGDNFFFSFHKYSKETPIDFHASSVAWGFNSVDSEACQAWESSESQLEFYPPTACWDGDRYVVMYWDESELIQRGAFFHDSIYSKGIGEDFSLGFMVMAYLPNDLQETKKYQALTSGGSGYFFISERGGWDSDLRHQMIFHILDSTVTPLDDSGSAIGFPESIDCFYPDAVFGNGLFLGVWENRFANNTIHLYAIEVDTAGEILKSGYVVQKSPVDKHPAIAFGDDQYLLVWTDNQNGDFNIYGRLFDTLEVFEGIEEQPLPVSELTSMELETNPNPFSRGTTISVPKGIRLEANTVINIYDNTGSQVNQLLLSKGQRSVVWDGTDDKNQVLCSGVYFVKPEGIGTYTTKIIKL